MTIARVYGRSFAAGEITPELFGRLDITKRQEGLALCRNAFTRPHGPVINRTGTEYVQAVKNSASKTRLTPFSYRSTQTYAVQVGAGYFRFHTNASTIQALPLAWSAAVSYLPNDLVTQGGTTYSCITANTNSAPPGANWRTTAWSSAYTYGLGDLVTSGGTTYYSLQAGNLNNAVTSTAWWYALPANGDYEIPNGYAAADLLNIHYVQSADVLTLVHPNYPPMELRRYGGIFWQFTQPSFMPPASTLSAPGFPAVVANSVTNWSTYAYAVTGVLATTGEETVISAPSPAYPTSVTGITQANPGVVTMSAAISNLAIGDTVIISGVGGMTQINGTWQVAVIAGAGTQLTLMSNGTQVNTTGFGAYTSGGTVSLMGVKNDLTLAGNKNVVSWTDSAPTGTYSRYNVYRYSNGVWAYVGQATNAPFTDQNIIPNPGITPPLIDTTMGGAGNNPAAVSYFQQRRCFAGSTNSPQNIWMTRSGTESNLSYSIPTNSSDRIAVRIAAREASAIEHLVPVANLIMLTASSEWQINGGAAYAVLTPTTFQAQPQAYVGANNVTPVTVGNTVLYAAARGGHIRELVYTWQFGAYVSNDISLMAPHLFDYNSVVDMCYSRGPLPMLFAVSSTGQLLSMTYVPEQQVAAWHHHDTGGNGAGTDVFEACCTITENGEDMLYVIVNRNINGVQTRFVERLRTRNYFNTPADLYFVDCGIQQSFGSPVTTVSGLTWLIGMTVNILADGAVVPQQVVDNTGSIYLPVGASTVTVGLPITCQIQTPPAAAQLDTAVGQGRPKNVNKVWLRTYQSSGIWVGPDFNSLQQYRQRTSESYGSPPNLITDEIEIVLSNEWGQSGSVCIQQTDPLPLDIADMTLEVSIGGG